MSDVFLSWLPVAAIAFILIVVGRSTARTYDRHVEQVRAINEKLVETNREIIAELREIKEILKDRN